MRISACLVQQNSKLTIRQNPTLNKIIIMKTQILRKYLLMLLVPVLSLSLITACSDDDNGTPVDAPNGDDPNLVELAQSDDNFSILVDLVVDLDLVDVLSTETLTVFAPTNAAFEALPDGLVESLTAEELTEIVTYHVTSGKILSTDLGAEQGVTMLNEEQTLVMSSAAGVQVNGSANVIQADLEATNGAIHAIDEVLLPSGFREPNLVDVALADAEGRFTTLASLVEDLGLTLRLQFLGPYTTFAPTNQAFENLDVDVSSLTEEELAGILTYHVSTENAPVMSSDLGPQQTVSTLALEEPVYVTAGDDGVAVNRTANVIQADVEASNGVIHVIDEVLLPNAATPVTGVVSKNYDLLTLLSLVAERPGVLETLSDPAGSFTVFAPNNEAFDEVLSANPDLTEEQATEILGYHVLLTEVLSGDLEETQTVETLGEEDIYVTVDNGQVTINNSATVAMADLQGNNGVVHIIDGVLLPNAFTPVTGIVAKNYNLSTLLSLVAEREDILDALSGDGEFTVFAPTNEAFDAALEAFPDLTDEEITEILTYHVLAAQVLSTDLSDGQTAETLQGEEITVSINDGVQINDANVTTVDLVGTNGVVHIIDAVILPPSFTE